MGQGSEPRGSTRPAFLRRIVTALLAVVLVGTAAQLVHVLTTEHTTCPQDGELVHGTRLATHPSSGSTRSDGPALYGSAARAAGHEDHGHCDVVLSWHERTAAVRDPPAPALIPESVSELVHEPVDVFGAHGALYLLAPKCSPPARA